jgi:hypothetical protein
VNLAGSADKGDGREVSDPDSHRRSPGLSDTQSVRGDDRANRIDPGMTKASRLRRPRGLRLVYIDELDVARSVDISAAKLARGQ